MYHIRTVQLKHGEITKEVPVIDFEAPEKAIIAEFLMSDSTLLADEMNEAMEQIENGERAIAVLTGNRCSLTIRPHTAIIEDLLEGIYEAELTYLPCEIGVKELQSLIHMWLEIKKTYESK